MDAIKIAGNSTFVFIGANRWVGLRFDMLCAIFGLTTALFSVYLKGVIENQLLAFSMQITVDAIILFSLALRFYAEAQNMMTAS